MKVIEILNFNRELLKRLQAAGIRLEDARYIDLYADYTRLLDQGEKVSYAVAVLSEKYSVSERKVYAYDIKQPVHTASVLQSLWNRFTKA